MSIMARIGAHGQGIAGGRCGNSRVRNALNFRYVIVHPFTEASDGGDGSRRAALLRGMIDAVGAHGYREVSVADAIAAAGVSRTTFYKHFGDKLDCYLAAYDAAADEVVATVEAGCEPAAPWVERVRGGLRAATELFAADPHLARALVVEVAAAGIEGQRRRAAMLERLAELLERAAEPTDPDVPPSTPVMAVGAAFGLISEEIESGRAAELPERTPDLLFSVLVPYLGPGAAGAETHPPLSPSPR